MEYTSKEVARKLGLSANSIRVFRRRYGIGHKHGLQFFFSETDIDVIQTHMGKIGRPKGGTDDSK